MGVGDKPRGRQDEILELAAKGYTDKEIAKILGISPGTLRTYWDRLRERTGARSRCEVLARSYGRAQNQGQGLRVLELLPLFIWTCRADGSLDYFNDWFLKLRRVDGQLLRTQGWCAIVTEGEREPCHEFFSRTLRSGTPGQQEFTIESDKSELPKRHLVRLVPVLDAAGSVAGWLGYAREMAQDADAQLASLLKGIFQDGLAALSSGCAQA